MGAAPADAKLRRPAASVSRREMSHTRTWYVVKSSLPPACLKPATLLNAEPPREPGLENLDEPRVEPRIEPRVPERPVSAAALPCALPTGLLCPTCGSYCENGGRGPPSSYPIDPLSRGGGLYPPPPDAMNPLPRCAPGRRQAHASCVNIYGAAVCGERRGWERTVLQTACASCKNTPLRFADFPLAEHERGRAAAAPAVRRHRRAVVQDRHQDRRCAAQGATPTVHADPPHPQSGGGWACVQPVQRPPAA
jgi:hypothetical protein